MDQSDTFSGNGDASGRKVALTSRGRPLALREMMNARAVDPFT
jgi:hypothetical protein